jgi:hypothetical protein
MLSGDDLESGVRKIDRTAGKKQGWHRRCRRHPLPFGQCLVGPLFTWRMNCFQLDVRLTF